MADVWTGTEERRLEGKRRAKATEARIKADEYRIQASMYLRNMVKALEIHSWNNTVEDWQRYYEAKYVLSLRSKKARR